MASDESLHEQFQRGDLRSFDELYRRHERPLFGYIIRQLGGDRLEAEDVLHDTFVAVLRDPWTPRGIGSLRGWLYQVARNLCLNRLRLRERGDRARSAFHVEPMADLQAEAEQRGAVGALRAAVQRLSEPLGEVYALRARGFSYDEISEVTGVPLGTVKSRMHEAMNRLRQEMAEWRVTS